MHRCPRLRKKLTPSRSGVGAYRPWNRGAMCLLHSSRLDSTRYASRISAPRRRSPRSESVRGADIDVPDLVVRLGEPCIPRVHGGNHRLRYGVAERRIFLPVRVGCTAEVEDHAACPHGYSADCPSCGQEQSKKKT